MSDFNPCFSLFKNAKANMPSGEVCLLDTLAGIRDGADRPAVDAIRAITGDDAKEVKKLREPLKKALRAVTFGGSFEKRHKEGLLQYSGIICIDIDNLEGAKLQAMRDGLQHNPLVYSYFISPSGNGLKILFRAPDLDAAKHEMRFELLSKSIAKSYGVEYDPTGRDVCRLCFLSYDAELYLNEDADVVLPSVFEQWEREFAPTPAKPAAQPKPAKKADKKETDLFQKCHEIVQKTTPLPVNGGYNNYTNLYAIQANRYGISETECWQHLKSTFAFPAYDDQRPVLTSVYSKFVAERGQYLVNTIFPADTSSSNPGKDSKATGDYDDSVKFWYVVGKIDKETGDIVCNAATGEPLGEYRYSYDDAITFLQRNGFYKYRGENNSYQLIKTDDGRKVMDIVIERQIKEFMLDYLKSNATAEFKRVREMFRRGSKNYCSTSMLEGLDYSNPTLRRDTKEAGYIYFQNCYLEITAEGIRRHDYSAQTNFIWAKQIKPFVYKEQEDYPTCDFARFLLYAITGAKREFDAYSDDEWIKYNAACTSIGYLLHRYKDATITKAVIATDKALRQATENEGRSGKSLLGKALEYMLICTPIDGRNFSFDSPFPFQRVNVDTQLINFNDIKPKFDFTRLFGMITEDFYFEPKGKPVVTIPFEDAPKFYLSSNSTLRGEGSSTRARQQILEFSNFFNEQHTPVQEFGRRFFHGGWDGEEWSRFYSFMAHCLHLYLKEGMLEFPLENYAINALYETPGAGEELINYLQEVVLEQLKHKQQFDSAKLFEAYKSANSSTKLDWLKKNTFTKWVKIWANIKGLAINAHRPDGRDRSNGIDWMTFSVVGEAVQIRTEEPTAAPAAGDGGETDLPF